jgi:hypothetical protein
VQLVVVVVVIGGFYLLAVHEQQNVRDYFALRNYTAPSAVAQLSSDDQFTSYANKVFLVNHPQIDTKAAFSKVCPAGTEQTVVLGCYHSNQAGIYLLGVSDPTLKGIEQVTAAHETLHAIYDRLSTSKRNQVDGWLLSYYNHGLTDPTIRTQIADYKKSEPNDWVNEMHSLFGTEVPNLPAQLENYYSQYFKNRKVITNDYQTYQAAFTTRENQITIDDGELNIFSTQINKDNTQLDGELSTIQSTQKSLQADQSSNQIAQYNQGVPGYNQLVNQYNTLVAAAQSLINQYNAIVATRNSIALEEQQLTNEITASKQAISN